MCTIPCGPGRAGAIGKVEQPTAGRYRSSDENGARVAAASRGANASKCKLWRGLTPVKFLALRIDVLHVENIFEQHARHVATYTTAPRSDVELTKCRQVRTNGSEACRVIIRLWDIIIISEV